MSYRSKIAHEFIRGNPLTTKTQRHEVLVKRLRMRMVISHWSLVISKEAKAEKRRKEAGRQEAGDSFDD